MVAASMSGIAVSLAQLFGVWVRRVCPRPGDPRGQICTSRSSWRSPSRHGTPRYTTNRTRALLGEALDQSLQLASQQPSLSSWPSPPVKLSSQVHHEPLTVFPPSRAAGALPVIDQAQLVPETPWPVRARCRQGSAGNANGDHRRRRCRRDDAAADLPGSLPQDSELKC